MSNTDSYFSQAHDFHIDTQNIITAHNVYQYRGSQRQDPLDRLLTHTALGASHNSAERGTDAPKCHPETRAAVQQEIMGWIEHGDRDTNPKRILWLSGPAGAGKTAIMGTIAEECHKKGWLAASFFFSASSSSLERRRNDTIITTLAYQLCEHEGLGRIKEDILAAIDHSPAILDKRLDEQLEVLILNPLRNACRLGSSTAAWPKVLIIDGIDECDLSPVHMAQSTQPLPRSEQEKLHREILSVLERAASSPGFPDSFPFRILIASRPEPAIHDFFSETARSTQNIFLDNKYNPDADITLYFKAKFDAIRRRYEGLPRNWVSEETIRSLVQEASGQFIYAATVIRFVESPERPPSQQLQRVLEWRQLDGSKPFTPLDLLYTRIIRTSPTPALAVKWIRSIQYMEGTLRSSFTGDDAYKASLFIRFFLEEYPGQMRYLLGDLSSLLRLPSEHDVGFGFHFYHKSLFDFIGSSERSGDVGFHFTTTAIARFLEAWLCAILKNKGSQVIPEGLMLSEWFRAYAVQWHAYPHPFCGEFTYSDVDWWVSMAAEHPNGNWLITFQFYQAHAECKWYRCRSACKVWRRGIVRHCKAESWDTPGYHQAIRDRFKRYSLENWKHILRPREVNVTA